jgi:hypothetical protein
MYGELVGKRGEMSFDDQFGGTGFHTDFDEYDSLELISPPNYLLFVQAGSTLIGLALGVFGLGVDAGSKYLFGGLGWLFAIAIPVVIVVYSQSSHQSRSQKGHELADAGKSYDAFAGEKLISRLTKALVVSFLLAAIPIYVLATPLGERFA